jgi:hypothetical protein
MTDGAAVCLATSALPLLPIGTVERQRKLTPNGRQQVRKRLRPQRRKLMRDIYESEAPSTAPDGGRALRIAQLHEGALEARAERKIRSKLAKGLAEENLTEDQISAVIEARAMQGILDDILTSLTLEVDTAQDTDDLVSACAHAGRRLEALRFVRASEYRDPLVED